MGRVIPIGLLAGLMWGCGTAVNLAPMPTVERTDQYWSVGVGPNRAVYGGVVVDLNVARKSIQTFPEHPRLAAVFLPASLIDLPFSAIGDTLTLPVMINASIMEYYHPRRRPNAEKVQADEGGLDVQIVESTESID